MTSQSIIPAKNTNRCFELKMAISSSRLLNESDDSVTRVIRIGYLYFVTLEIYVISILHKQHVLTRNNILHI